MRKFTISKGYIISPWEERVQQTNGNTISIEPAFKFLLK
jgi:hypothetical protein